MPIESAKFTRITIDPAVLSSQSRSVAGTSR